MNDTIDYDALLADAANCIRHDAMGDTAVSLIIKQSEAIRVLRAAAVESERDAGRYRFIRPRMVGVNFDWDDEGMTALAFEMPKGVSFGADCDKNIEAAMAAQEKANG